MYKILLKCINIIFQNVKLIDCLVERIFTEFSNIFKNMYDTSWYFVNILNINSQQI